MRHVVPPCPQPEVPVEGGGSFPVHRIYCVGRNYPAHAREMGGSDKEPPFFFMKPADAVVTSGRMSYPPATSNLHHEVELVVAIGKGGRQIPVEHALEHVFGYAVGLDMTRRDLQREMKDKGQPWSIAKGFDESAPIGAILPVARAGSLADARVRLRVNGERRQESRIDQMLWGVAEIIAHTSAAWTLVPGDLLFTGTPEGVGPLRPGDQLVAEVDGLPPLALQIVAA